MTGLCAASTADHAHVLPLTTLTYSLSKIEAKKSRISFASHPYNVFAPSHLTPYLRLLTLLATGLYKDR